MRGVRIAITFCAITGMMASIFVCIAFSIACSNSVCLCAVTCNFILRSAISVVESDASDLHRLGFGDISALLGAVCISIYWFSVDASGVLAAVAVCVSISWGWDGFTGGLA